MGTAALTPLKRQSVWRTLKSIRLLKTELLAGLVVSLALIPEVIAFTVIAGVDPRVGIFASFTMSVVIAFTGGLPRRPEPWPWWLLRWCGRTEWSTSSRP